MNDAEKYKSKPLYLSDFQQMINRISSEQKTNIILYSEIDIKKHYRKIEFDMPIGDFFNQHQFMCKRYFLAMLNNMIVSFGGINMSVYFDSNHLILRELIDECMKEFDIDSPTNCRSGYGLYVNYLNRMNHIIGESKFAIYAKDIHDFKILGEEYVLYDAKNQALDLIELKRCATELENRCFCSLDVGGNSIKGVVVLNGKTRILTEYSWFPTDFIKAYQLINPILALIQYLNACVTAMQNGEIINPVCLKYSTCEELAIFTDSIKQKYIDTKHFDGITIGFPDIVLHNKIAGGETYKQRGMRQYNKKQYEREFTQISNLDEDVKKLMKPDGSLVILNDGNAAAYVVSIEQRFAQESILKESCMIAHTIGTELGTGLVSCGGTIQEIPLEGYQNIIDIGSVEFGEFKSDDVRSICNLNTEISGTAQKYISQFGLFRLSIVEMLKTNTALFHQLVENGFLEIRGSGIYFKTKPQDMRGQLTKYLIDLLKQDNPQVIKCFETMGKALGVLIDQYKLMFPELSTTRLISGGIAGSDLAFSLICKGLSSHNSEYNIVRIDEKTVHSPLLKDTTAEQRNFCTAIGSVCIANRKIIVNNRLKGVNQ